MAIPTSGMFAAFEAFAAFNGTTSTVAGAYRNRRAS
jgi:hypothetical protein